MDTTELLTAVIKDFRCELKMLKGYAESMQPSYELAMRLMGFALSQNAWENNGEALVASGTVTLEELPVYREDVYDMVSARMDPAICADTEFPFRVMDAARKGKYCSIGMDTKTEQTLLRLGLPEWFVDYLRIVQYLPKREHGKAKLEQILEALP